MMGGDTGLAEMPSAPGIVAPAVRDLGELSARLTTWLQTRLSDARNLIVTDLSYPLGAGMSHETILFDARWRADDGEHRRGMVVRIKPTSDQVYLDDLFVEQYRLMQVMHDHGGVRVARPLWFESDPSLLGAPFFVMEKLLGRVAVSYPPYAQQGWLVEAAPAERRTLWENSVRQLAAIQRMPVTAAAFLDPEGHFSDGFGQEVDRWRRYLDWVDPEGDLKALRDGFAELLADAPANRPAGIVWGDARLGNMMIGDDYRVVAVMDWEQPSLGGALHDLGWWLVTERNQTVGRGVPMPEGMGARDETIALWNEVSGKSAADVAWYEAFAVFKMECLAVRMSRFRPMPGLPAPGEMLRRFRAV